MGTPQLTVYCGSTRTTATQTMTQMTTTMTTTTVAVTSPTSSGISSPGPVRSCEPRGRRTRRRTAMRPWAARMRTRTPRTAKTRTSTRAANGGPQPSAEARSGRSSIRTTKQMRRRRTTTMRRRRRRTGRRTRGSRRTVRGTGTAPGQGPDPPQASAVRRGPAMPGDRGPQAGAVPVGHGARGQRDPALRGRARRTPPPTGTHRSRTCSWSPASGRSAAGAPLRPVPRRWWSCSCRTWRRTRRRTASPGSTGLAWTSRRSSIRWSSTTSSRRGCGPRGASTWRAGCWTGASPCWSPGSRRPQPPTFTTLGGSSSAECWRRRQCAASEPSTTRRPCQSAPSSCSWIPSTTASSTYGHGPTSNSATRPSAATTRSRWS
mmetsp:Transcript_95105/g.164131  ORF Transcript_95105/g.164131 Transcript_95105/m.164131 type:complete len:376 (+) Transcript_95105:1495-2622(+)